MSSQTATPPWVKAFKSQLDGHEKDQAYTTYAFATLDKEGNPKVRHVIHRFLTPASNLLITTTDTRMAKPAHLASSPTVELAWWIEATAVQFRITGHAYTLPSNPGDEGYKQAMSDALAGLKATGDEEQADFWEKERKRLWKEAMSGHLRASFGRPTPGKELKDCPDPKEWPERLDAESDDPKEQEKIDNALSHFALVAIRPVAFEMLELKPTPNVRTQWEEQKDGSWKEKNVAP